MDFKVGDIVEIINFNHGNGDGPDPYDSSNSAYTGLKNQKLYVVWFGYNHISGKVIHLSHNNYSFNPSVACFPWRLKKISPDYSEGF